MAEWMFWLLKGRGHQSSHACTLNSCFCLLLLAFVCYRRWETFRSALGLTIMSTLPPADNSFPSRNSRDTPFSSLGLILSQSMADFISVEQSYFLTMDTARVLCYNTHFNDGLVCGEKSLNKRGSGSLVGRLLVPHFGVSIFQHFSLCYIMKTLGFLSQD